MASWATLVQQVQIDMGDPLGVFHTDDNMQSYLAQAELLLTMRRALYERTQTLPLTGTPLYAIHAIFPDFIRPLRATVNGVALRWSSLAAVGRLHRQWYTEKAEAESVFMVGTTLLGFAPLPIETSAVVTYLAVPPAGVADPVIDTPYHPTLKKYAEAVALAKEGEIQRAATALKEFVGLASIPRDPEFLENLAQKSATVTRTTERAAND